jgi:hypothetical protein
MKDWLNAQVVDADCHIFYRISMAGVRGLDVWVNQGLAGALSIKKVSDRILYVRHSNIDVVR